MSPRLPSLVTPPIGFGVATKPDADATDDSANTEVAAYRRLIRLGVTGVDATVWSSADGVPLISSRGRTGRGIRQRKLSSIRSTDAAKTTLPLEALLQIAGADADLSLRVADPSAFDAILAQSQDADAEKRLWLRHHDMGMLTSWRPRTTARLILSSDKLPSGGGLERTAADLEQRSIDGLLLPHHLWSGGRTTLFHRFGRLALGSGPVHEREIASLIDAGIDGVHTDQIERMMAVIVEYHGSV